MASYKVAVLPGDGVGPEIIREGLKVIRAALESVSLEIEFTELEIGAARYRRTGAAFGQEDIEKVRKADAVYFGAVGLPDVRLPDGREVQSGYSTARTSTFTPISGRSSSIPGSNPL